MAELVLDKLRELQQAELELRRLEGRKNAQDRAAKIRLEQIQKHNELIESLRGKQKQTRMSADRKELDVRAKRADIVKLRGQQMLVKDNRQFTALQNEIKFAELTISKLEDEILADMGDFDAVDQEVRKAQEELKRLEADLSNVRKEIEARKDAISAEIAQRRQARDDIAKVLPAKVVELFTRICERHNGDALAPVVRDEDDDEGGYVCGGCHMNITPNTYVRLAGRGDNLFTCQSCSRILFLESS